MRSSTNECLLPHKFESKYHRVLLVLYDKHFAEATLAKKAAYFKAVERDALHENCEALTTYPSGKSLLGVPVGAGGLSHFWSCVSASRCRPRSL